MLVCCVPFPASAQCECDAEDTLVVGHRGDGSGGDENTVASVERAFAAGADMVEIDVQLSADGVVVLMHDDTVDRTTEGTGCVSAQTAAELDTLGVPSLATLLTAVDGALDVEIKLHDTDACPAQDLEALASAVAADLSGDPVAGRRVLVTSFDRALLQQLHADAPALPIGLLGASPTLIDDAVEDGFEAAVLFGPVLNPRTVDRARDADIALYAWTINGPDELADTLELGIEGVITDTISDATTARDTVCATWTCGTDAGPVLDAGTGEDTGGGGCVVSHTRTSPVWMLATLGLWLRRRRRGVEPHSFTSQGARRV
ncbi:MAG: glycerophosphodiester phosphodiesterase [Sandaracinaceae bacterium]